MMRNRFPSLVFVALCGLAPVALGTLLHWSAELWGFMSLVTASGSLLLVLTLHSGGGAPGGPDGAGTPAPPERPAPPTEQPFQETRVVDAALPSAADGYDFLFSATVWWRPVPGHADRADGAFPALAVSSVLSRAVGVVRHEEPGRSSFARYLLEGELAVALPDRSGRVRAQATDVTLTLAAADRERLRKLADLRKDEEIWEYERQHERNNRRYLGDDVLRSPGSAVVWWLARHEDDIEKAVDMIGPLAQIAAAANDEEVPELFRHLLVPPVDAREEATVGGPLWDGQGQTGGMPDAEEEVGVADRLLLLLSAVGLKPGMDEYTVLVHRVVRSLEVAGLEDAAEEIRRTVLHTDEEDGEDGEEEESPSGAPSSEEDATGPWSPRFSASDGPPFSAPSPGRDADPSRSGPEAPANGTNRAWWDTNGDDMTPPYFWDTSHSPHRPEDTEDENES